MAAHDYVPRISDDYEYTIQGNTLPNASYPCTLKVKLNDNNPYFELDTKLKIRDRPFKVEIPMKLTIFHNFMELMKLVVNSENNDLSFETTLYGHPFIYDKVAGKSIKSKDKLPVAKARISRTEDGIIQLTITSKQLKDTCQESPVITFGKEEYLDITSGGKPYLSRNVSNITCLGWINSITEVVHNLSVTQWVEPEWKAKKRKERNAENAKKYGNNQQSTGTDTSDAMDDAADIPF